MIFSFGATGLTLIAFAELVSVMYVYGHKRFTDDIENMTGKLSVIIDSLLSHFDSGCLC